MEGFSQRVQAFMARLDREDVCMHGFTLSVDGKMLVKAYYAPFTEGEPHRMYSVSKTMTCLAIGMLMDEGKLHDTDCIVHFFQDYLNGKPDPRLARLTIRDMLRMSTCFRSTTYREGIDENWAKTFFEVTPTHEPGTVFYYDTSCSQVLAALVQRLSGKSVLEYLQEHLFAPIGANDPKEWLTDPSGTCQGGTGLMMSLRDLNKVAQWLLDGGQGMLSPEFVAEMTRCQIGTPLQTNEEEQYGYGFQCWRTRAGYAMYGLGGQLAVACPEKKALLCTIADTRLDPVGVQRIYNAFFEELYPWLDPSLEPLKEIKAKVKPLKNKPQYAAFCDGTYDFGENMLGLRSLRLEGQTLQWENQQGSRCIRFDFGENLQTLFLDIPEAPALSSAGWIAPGVLRIRCYLIGKAPCGVDMLLSFTPDSVTVQSRRSHDPFTNGFDGVASGYRRK